MKNLSCFLCAQSLRNPHLCPHCSQIFCQQCIKEYLALKHFCPTCDNYIIDLVDCSRLVREVQEVVHQRNDKNKIQKLIKQPYKLNVNSNINKKRINNGNRIFKEHSYQHKQQSNISNHDEHLSQCKQHNLQLIYFCIDCDRWICSDCGLIQIQHRQHRIIPKNQLFKHKKQQLISELNKINDNIHKIGMNKEKCILDLEVYRAEFKWAKSKIQKYCEELLSKIDGQGEKQMQQLIETIKQYEEKLRLLTKQKNQLQNYIKLSQSPNSSSSLSLSQTIVLPFLNPRPQIIDLESCSAVSFLQKPRKIQTLEQIFPAYENFTYEFDYKNFKNDNYHYSEYFELWGQDWRLKIYPNGNTGDGRYLSVFLQLANGHAVEKSRRYLYRVQLLSLNRVGSTIVREYCSKFETGESWGYKDFLNLQNLTEYLHQGKLLFCIGIRNQSYEGLSIDLKKYIIKISNQNSILQKLLCESSNPNTIPLAKISSIHENDQESIIEQYLSQYKFRNEDSEYGQGQLEHQRESNPMKKIGYNKNVYHKILGDSSQKVKQNGRILKNRTQNKQYSIDQINSKQKIISSQVSSIEESKEKVIEMKEKDKGQQSGDRSKRQMYLDDSSVLFGEKSIDFLED